MVSMTRVLFKKCLNLVKMKKYLIFIILFTCYNAFSQQFKSTKFIDSDVDSIRLITVYYPSMDEIHELKPRNTKDFPRILSDEEVKKQKAINQEDSIVKSQNIPKKIDSCTLSNLETRKVLNLIKKPNYGHALPGEYDIQLDLYKKNKVVQIVTISSQTKNLVIKKGGCKTHIDENGQEIDPCFFRGMVSENLKKYIVSLLKSKKLWNKEQQFMEDYK